MSHAHVPEQAKWRRRKIRIKNKLTGNLHGTTVKKTLPKISMAATFDLNSSRVLDDIYNCVEDYLDDNLDALENILIADVFNGFKYFYLRCKIFHFYL